MSKRERAYLTIGVAVIVAIPLLSTLERRYIGATRMRPTGAEFQQRLSRIRVDDGIDSVEAKEIAQIYMREYIWEYVNGCGEFEPLALRNGRWTAEFRKGVTGARSDITIQINPTTGAVASSVGPTFRTFREFAQDLVDGADRRR
jgi:hypothetical protein